MTHEGPRAPSWWGCLLLALLGGCLPPPPAETDAELVEALGLPPQTPVVRLDLADRAGAIGVFPSERTLPEGAVVQFVTRDARVYSIHFDEAALSPEGWEFLERTGQSSSPPLVDRGVRFVLSFAGAPPGIYPFRVEGQGRRAEGRLVVVDPDG
jgi:hypothetical protein